MRITNRQEAILFFQLLDRYYTYCEQLKARMPEGEALRSWGADERALAKSEAAQEAGLSEAERLSIERGDIRASIEQAAGLFEIPKKL